MKEIYSGKTFEKEQEIDFGGKKVDAIITYGYRKSCKRCAGTGVRYRQLNAAGEPIDSEWNKCTCARSIKTIINPGKENKNESEETGK